MAGPAVCNRRNSSQRRLRSGAVTEEAMDAVVTGMNLMAESERLERRAIGKIKRQDVHQGQSGNNQPSSYKKPGNKPRFFHYVHQGKRGIPSLMPVNHNSKLLTDVKPG